MLPYTPLHHLLFADAPYDALVMTSGNLSEEPIVVAQRRSASTRLGGVADWFLLHNRDIYMRADDSVVRTFRRPRSACCAARAAIAPQTHRPGPRRARTAGLRRRTEERLLPHQGPPRHPQPAHRRPGELRDAGLLRGDPRQPEEAVPRGAARRGARSAPRLPQHAVRAGNSGSAEDRRAAPSRAHRQLHGRRTASRAK